MEQALMTVSDAPSTAVADAPTADFTANASLACAGSTSSAATRHAGSGAEAPTGGLPPSVQMTQLDRDEFDEFVGYAIRFSQLHLACSHQTPRTKAFGCLHANL